jgi:hypothetical protein
MTSLNRRWFLQATAGGLGLHGLLGSLGRVSAEDVQVSGGIAQFSSEMEPLVRFLEQTPRDQIIEQTATRIHEGLSYRHLLGALLLAGVRNVQPRPSVGFKFHAVLVVNSAHLASLSSADEDRWLPILWAIDNFKSSQQRDVREGNWTLPPVDETAVPPARRATAALRQSLDRWDEAAADVAITSMVRNFGANAVFAELARYASRDFRSIGHKVIYLSNAFRTLQTIGWEYSEPVMRSLVYAMLNHHGEPNPADSDLAADRPGRFNRELAAKMPEDWLGGSQNSQATIDLLGTLREANPQDASAKVVELLSGGVSVAAIWDAIYAASGELLMQQPGIVALHSVTTTNAIHHAFTAAANDQTRRFLLLQNASFVPMFRQAARDRGALANRRIDQLEPESDQPITPESVSKIFVTMGSNREQASREMLGFLAGGGNPSWVADHARRLVFLKGNDSHDYKFSSAALEDYRVLSPEWRNRFIAASTYQLRDATLPTRPLVQRIEKAI